MAPLLLNYRYVRVSENPAEKFVLTGLLFRIKAEKKFIIEFEPYYCGCAPAQLFGITHSLSLQLIAKFIQIGLVQNNGPYGGQIVLDKKLM